MNYKVRIESIPSILFITNILTITCHLTEIAADTKSGHPHPEYDDSTHERRDPVKREP